MRHRARAVSVVLFLLALPLDTIPAPDARAMRVQATDGSGLRDWDARVEAMVGAGELVPRQARPDTLLPGRQHERLAQRYRGVPVFGGEVVRQRDDAGTLSIFGTLYEGIDLDPRPSLTARDVVARVEARGGRLFGREAGPELTILPRDEGGYVLTYRVRALHEGDGFAVRMSFFDACTGELVLEYSDLQAQAVGTGTGVLGDRKKISTRPSGGAYLADDRLRPPVILTYDFKGDIFKFLSIPSVDALSPSDLAADTDNDWTDGAAVDAHVYAGFTYDYFFKRFGRRGLDNANIPIHSLTHVVRRQDFNRNLAIFGPDILDFYFNAAYLGDGAMFYGEGLPTVLLGGQRHDFYAGALDIVTHELTHGVTDYSSGLIYRNESGALNESFSDVMAVGAEFFFQSAGGGPQRPDYVLGEDVITPGGIRSLQSPIAYGDPDHYSIRYTGSQDNGGVHINSGIPNHAFYLAIEGGTNRVSGIRVQGVGGANREQVERAFYRAFTSFLTPAATFSQAKAATIQAARELYGAGSAAERAVTQAWVAVGVQ